MDIKKLLFEKDNEGKRFWERDLFAGRAKPRASGIAEICRMTGIMLESGINLKQVILVLANGSKDKKLKSCLDTTLDGIEKGGTLSDSLAASEYFPAFVCDMCHVGELSNRLPKIMTLLADYYEEVAKNRDEIKSALMYPAIIAVMMFLLIVAAVLYVLPHYALIFETSDAPLPALTQTLLGFSGFVTGNPLLSLLSLAAVIMLPALFLRSKPGKLGLERILLKAPFISDIYKQKINLHISQVMALFLESGRPLAEAVLSLAGTLPNSIIQNDFQKLSAGLQEGLSFWPQLEGLGYIDPLIVNMCKVGEETGNMAKVFNHAHNYSRDKLRRTTGRLNKLAEPVVTIILGLVLGLVMLAIIMPTFAMTEFIG